ncbi:MAG: hypothetical protein Q9181_002955 [Wetmoreana brouardii]
MNVNIVPGISCTASIDKAALLALAAYNPAGICFTGRNISARLCRHLRSTKAPSLRLHALTFIQGHLSPLCETIRAAHILITKAGDMAERSEVKFELNYLGHAVLLRLLRPPILRTAQDISEGGGGDLVGDRERSSTPWLHRTKSSSGSSRQTTQAPSSIPIGRNPAKRAHILLWAATTAKRNLEGGKYHEPVGNMLGKPNFEIGGLGKGSSQQSSTPDIDQATATVLSQGSDTNVVRPARIYVGHRSLPKEIQPRINDSI